PEGAVPELALTPDAMERALLKHWAATPEDLDALKASRASVVHAWLTGDQRLAADRAILSNPADTNVPPLIHRVVEFSLE
ncbi:MAG: hypothetical protein J0L84_12520, partial [Verrucomicrobia bacterium]|nr:hypothetical protein [Verrucomicrobiota bacterium]